MYITYYISTCAASLSFISVIFSKCEAPSFSRACAAARSWQQAPQVSGAVLFFYFFFIFRSKEAEYKYVITDTWRSVLQARSMSAQTQASVFVLLYQ